MAVERTICDLRAALARMGGNVALLKQMAEFCREDLPQYLAKLKAAVADGDAVNVQQAAHSIKGMVVNFDAAGATAAAVRLELMGQAGNLHEAEAASEDLHGEIERLLAALASELPTL